MILRLTATLLLTLLSLGVASARETKVMERSAKSTPVWLSSPTQGYMVAEAEASDMGTARQRAVDELARQIVMAVAANVLHTSRASGSYENSGSGVSESESFRYDTNIASANIPFIKGITLAEAADTYWEKLREKDTDRILYRFAVLYPLSAEELGRMRAEFEKTDREKQEEFDSLKEGLHKAGSTADIEEAITALESLKAYFFDNVRRTQAEGLQKDYRGLYKSLTLHTAPGEGNTVIAKVLLDGRPFRVAGVPRLKSDCASRLEAQPLPDSCGYIITYDPIDCLPGEEHWIDFNLRMHDTRLSKRIYL
ncbi:MAG: hypothetical protein K2O24_08725 [Muribaculaceae bacterium]|nr:hypothetical protein [Muribaculaceae bacterium]